MRMISRHGESSFLALPYTSRLQRLAEVTCALVDRPVAGLSRLACLTRHGTLKLSA